MPVRLGPRRADDGVLAIANEQELSREPSKDDYWQLKNFAMTNCIAARVERAMRWAVNACNMIAFPPHWYR
jgi:hypothetical protein